MQRNRRIVVRKTRQLAERNRHWLQVERGKKQQAIAQMPIAAGGSGWLARLLLDAGEINWLAGLRTVADGSSWVARQPLTAGIGGVSGHVGHSGRPAGSRSIA